MKDEFHEDVETLSVSDSLEIGIRDYVSLSHVWSACFMARSCGALEQTDDALPDRHDRHFAFFCASIGAAADFLDASINELIQDARDDQRGGPTQRMSANQVTALALTPPLASLRREGVLDKYDIAAKAAGVVPPLRGQSIGQDAALVLAVKNALSHWVPELVTTVADDSSAISVQEMERRLKKLQLAPNPFAGPGHPFFPRRAATHGLAAWCCTTAMAYVEEYFGRFGVVPPFQHLRPLNP